MNMELWIAISVTILVLGGVFLLVVFTRKMDQERTKLWLNFSKYILGFFILGLIGKWIENGLKEREIAIKETEQLGKFIDTALDKDVSVRRRLSQYFATVTVSEDQREGWKRYADSLKIEEYEQIVGLKNTIDSLRIAFQSSDIKNTDLLLKKADRKVKRLLVPLGAYMVNYRGDKDDDRDVPKIYLNSSDLTATVYYHLTPSSQQEEYPSQIIASVNDISLPPPNYEQLEMKKTFLLSDLFKKPEGNNFKFKILVKGKPGSSYILDIQVQQNSNNKLEPEISMLNITIGPEGVGNREIEIAALISK